MIIKILIDNQEHTVENSLRLDTKVKLWLRRGNGVHVHLLPVWWWEYPLVRINHNGYIYEVRQ